MYDHSKCSWNTTSPNVHSSQAAAVMQEALLKAPPMQTITHNDKNVNDKSVVIGVTKGIGCLTVCLLDLSRLSLLDDSNLHLHRIYRIYLAPVQGDLIKDSFSRNISTLKFQSNILLEGCTNHSGKKLKKANDMSMELSLSHEWELSQQFVTYC